MAGKKKEKGTPRNTGDVISITNSGDGSAIAGGRGAKATVKQAGRDVDPHTWRQEMEKQIDAHENLPPADKADMKENVAKIADELAEGKKANPGRIERHLNMICSIAPDIFEVAVATLGNPLAGLGLVAKKIGDRAKLEAQ